MIFSNYAPKESSDQISEQAHPATEVYPWIPNPVCEAPWERGKNWSASRRRDIPNIGIMSNRNRFNHGGLFHIDGLK